MGFISNKPKFRGAQKFGFAPRSFWAAMKRRPLPEPKKTAIPPQCPRENAPANAANSMAKSACRPAVMRGAHSSPIPQFRRAAERILSRRPRGRSAPMPQRKIHIRKKFLTISGISVKKKIQF